MTIDQLFEICKNNVDELHKIQTYQIQDCRNSSYTIAEKVLFVVQSHEGDDKININHSPS